MPTLLRVFSWPFSRKLCDRATMTSKRRHLDRSSRMSFSVDDDDDDDDGDALEILGFSSQIPLASTWTCEVPKAVWSVWMRQTCSHSIFSTPTFSYGSYRRDYRSRCNGANARCRHWVHSYRGSRPSGHDMKVRKSLDLEKMSVS